jgi:uncharacterized protein (TIGR02145 family)
MYASIGGGYYNTDHLVEMLLNKGANVNLQSNNGWTALIIASEGGNAEIVKLLLDHGANPDIKNIDGMSAMHMALERGNRNTDIITLLLEKGAKPDLLTINGTTPLMMASNTGNTEIVQLLLDRGANVNLRTNNMGTALMQACNVEVSELMEVYQERNYEIVKLLLQKGANLDLQNIEGETALYLASKNGNTGIVKFLLDQGANPELKNTKGKTAFDDAKEPQIRSLLYTGNNFTPAKTVTENDGNVYHTVMIGTQIWMAENLKTTRYRNGDPIPNVADGMLWSNLTTGAYCDYDNKPGNGTTYGKLYNWYAVTDSRKLCPAGWHLPGEDEWTMLEDYLDDDAAGKLKETDTKHWLSSDEETTNETGFTALPGGVRFEDSEFSYLRERGCWWSSTLDSDSTEVECPWMQDNMSYLGSTHHPKESGISVRCIKD